MKGLINKVVTVACLGGVASLGCVRYQDVVDPCWPERYNHMARQEVNDSFAPQVRNGHILDQTIWNYLFEYDEVRGTGTARLTPAGQERLSYLSRRRPCPDSMLFLQTAYDLPPFDPNRPEEFVQRRSELDRSRVATIQGYLKAQTAGRPMPFEVVVHDPGSVGLAGTPANRTIIPPTGMYGAFGPLQVSPAGMMPIGGVFGSTSSGGSAGR
jgi:hypothetical protein